MENVAKLNIRWFKSNSHVYGTSYHLETYSTKNTSGRYIALNGLSIIGSVRRSEKKQRKLKWNWTIIVAIDDYDYSLHVSKKAAKAEIAMDEAYQCLLGLCLLAKLELEFEMDNKVYNKR